MTPIFLTTDVVVGCIGVPLFVTAAAVVLSNESVVDASSLHRVVRTDVTDGSAGLRCGEIPYSENSAYWLRRFLWILLIFLSWKRMAMLTVSRMADGIKI